MLNCFSYVLTLPGVLARTPSCATFALLALVYILVTRKVLKVLKLMDHRVPWKSEKWRKDSIVKRMSIKGGKLQRKARSFSIRIRESAFPSNKSDGLLDLFDKNGCLMKLNNKSNHLSFVQGPSSVMSRIEQSICSSLSDEGQLLVHALRVIGVFGAANMWVLKGICSNVQALEYFKEGENICLAIDETPDLIVLVSGSAAVHMQVEDNLGSTTKRRVALRDKPGSLLTSVMDILSMVVHCENGSIPGPPLFLHITAETPCSVVRVKASKISDFLRDKVDLSTRAHIIRMILIWISQLSFGSAYRYLGLVHSIPEPLEPIPPPATIHVDECNKEEDIIRLVSQSLGLLHSETEELKQLFPIIHVQDNSTHDEEMQSQEESSQKQKFNKQRDTEVGMHVFQLESGDALMGERDPRPCFYVVLSGCLKVSITEVRKALFTSTWGQSDNNAATASSPGHLFTSHDEHSYGPGSVIGLAALLMGATTTVYCSPDGSSTPMMSVQADGPASVVRVSAQTHDVLISKYPIIVQHVARSLLQRMPLVIQLIDRAVTIFKLEATEVLMQKDEPCHSLYFVLHGKLIATSPNDCTGIACNTPKLGQNDDELLWVYRRGAVIGESEILAQGPNLTKVIAAIPSKLAQLEGNTLALLYSIHPSVVANIARTAVLKRSSHRQGNAGLHNMGHARSFFIVPASPGASLKSRTLYRVAQELGVAFARVGRIPGMICPRVIATHMGVNLDYSSERGISFSDTILQAFSSWIPALEEKNDVALYCAEDRDFPWAKDYNLLCKQQADVVLLLVDAADTPRLSQLESELGVGSSKCLQYSDNVLIVLHKDPTEGYNPTNTSKWFEDRSIQRHYHVRLEQSKQLGSSPDFLRVTRCLTGQGLGLVLGGGGARGFVHLGLLRALEEEKIPVDVIVGTSIGAFLGALYAFDHLISRIIPIAQGFSKRMRLTWAMVMDLTFPITSYFTGAHMNMYLMETFQSRCIEDSWIPYACVTTNIMDSNACIHHNGTAWRYVRASMTLVGILPPLCEKFQDPSSGQMKVAYLVDGGYVSVLPMDTARTLGAWAVIASDVVASSKFTSNMVDFGDTLSGIWAFFTVLFSNVRSRIPSMGIINAELAFLSARREIKSTKIHVPRDLYLRPPCGEFGTLQFDCYSKIMMLGYDYATKRIREWKEQNQKIGELCSLWPEQLTIEDQESILYGFF